MKNRFFTVSLIILGCFLLPCSLLLAQSARTGTNLNSKAMPSEVLQLREPDEVGRIRQLLIDGKKNDALKAAVDYIDQVDRTKLLHETLPRYYAWNAYCTVLTSLHRIDEAILACNTAMDYEPGKWSAVNNRGTAKFVGGNLEEAMEDYEKAMSMVDEANTRVRETIQHNINLVMERQGSLN